MVLITLLTHSCEPPSNDIAMEPSSVRKTALSKSAYSALHFVTSTFRMELACVRTTAKQMLVPWLHPKLCYLVENCEGMLLHAKYRGSCRIPKSPTLTLNPINLKPYL